TRIQLSFECRGKRPRDATRLARSDGSGVELDDRRDIGGRSRDEQLIETTDLLLENRRLAHGDALFDCKLEDDVSRYAGQDVVRAWIRPQLAVEDAEDVRVRAFRDDAVADEHGLERTRGNRVLL